MSKDKFKSFVKDHPQLIKYVKNGDMTWQKFYEIYDLYGESDDAWNDYLKSETVNASGSIGIADFLSWLKTVNLDSLQEGIGNVQRVLGVVQDLASKDTKKEDNSYKPRPLYKHFED